MKIRQIDVFFIMQYTKNSTWQKQKHKGISFIVHDIDQLSEYYLRSMTDPNITYQESSKSNKDTNWLLFHEDILESGFQA